MKRQTKRGVIIFIYVALIGGVAAFIWWYNQPLPTCIDGRQNGDETAVDCGGSCGACTPEITAKDLEIVDTYVVFGGVGRFDAIVKVKNPNSLYGAAIVKYTIALMDGDAVLAEEKGEAFILPTQERYFIATNMETEQIPRRVAVTIDDVEWIQFTDFQDPDFVVQDIAYGPVRGGRNYAEAFALVRNNSNFDFAEVNVYVVIKDPRGVPIAVNKNQMGNFEAHDERDFTLSWPYRFPGTMADIDVEVYANVFDSQNFVDQYLPGGRFEQLR